MDQLRKTLPLQEDYSLAIGSLGEAYVQKGLFDEAASLYRKMPRPLGHLAYVSAVSGNEKDARTKLSTILRAADREGFTEYQLAKLYASLGDADEAMRWLEEVYNERIFNMFSLRVDPGFDRIRSEPRFSVLLKKLGLNQ